MDEMVLVQRIVRIAIQNHNGIPMGTEFEMKTMPGRTARSMLDIEVLATPSVKVGSALGLHPRTALNV
jgi:hypothetical protein